MSLKGDLLQGIDNVKDAKPMAYGRVDLRNQEVDLRNQELFGGHYPAFGRRDAPQVLASQRGEVSIINLMSFCTPRLRVNCLQGH
jgi:hypothetical protein